MPRQGGAKAESASRDPRGGLPPRVIRPVAAEGGADGGAKLPIKESQQVMIQDVAVDARVVRELGHVGTLPGGHHFGGGVVNARDRRAHFVTGAHRLPSACIALLARAKGGPQRGGGRVMAKDGDRVVNARSVPSQQLTRVFRRAGHNVSNCFPWMVRGRFLCIITSLSCFQAGVCASKTAEQHVNHAHMNTCACVCMSCQFKMLLSTRRIYSEHPSEL